MTKLLSAARSLRAEAEGEGGAERQHVRLHEPATVVVIRCTQKLLRRVGSSAQVTGGSTTRLGEWHGTVFGVGRRRIAIFISERSRLPVLLPERGLKEVALRLPPAVGEVLTQLAVPEAQIRDELEAMEDMLVAPTNNRSLLGSLNDFVQGAKSRLETEPLVELLPMALWLAETPVGPMQYDAPDDVTRRIFGLPPLPRRAV